MQASVIAAGAGAFLSPKPGQMPLLRRIFTDRRDSDSQKTFSLSPTIVPSY
jgi:hypothetical protein